MVTRRRTLAVLLASVVVLGWFALLRPTALGGPASYIIVSGESMEPTYEDGDLVVLRRRGSYSEGDIVAYPIASGPNSGRTVIHRIVGSDDEGFVTRGDNRDNVDPWRAGPAQIRGEAWIRVPGAGRYLAWLREPWHLAGAAFLVFLAGGLQRETTHRIRRHRMKRIPGTNRGRFPAGAAFPTHQQGLLLLAGVAAIVAVASLALAILAYRSPAEKVSQASRPAFRETGSFDYAIVMEPSTLYPDGVLRPAAPEAEASAEAGDSPAPAFTNLAKTADLTFRYELEADEPPEIGGTISATLQVHPAREEWTRTVPLLEATAFEGASVTKDLQVDLVSVGALISRIEEETGLAGSPYSLEVVARVDAMGIAEEPVETSFEATFVLTYDRILIRPPANLTTTAEAVAAEPAAAANSLALGFWTPDVTVARTVAVVTFTSMLGALLACVAVILAGLRADEEARIRVRYGARLVDVEGTGEALDTRAIRVASMRDLARVAERAGSVILHAPAADRHRYVVRDGEDSYEYVVDSDPGAGSFEPADHRGSTR